MVLGAGPGDAAALLRLTAAQGAIRRDGASAIRPVIAPTRGTLQGDTLAADPAVASSVSFGLELDGAPAIQLIAMGIDDTESGEALLLSVADAIESAVRTARPLVPAFAGFRAVVEWAAVPGQGHISLISGTGGPGSSVHLVTSGNAADDLIMANLGLLNGGTSTDGEDRWLVGGGEQPFDLQQQLEVFEGSRANRTGLYALESIENFNLLCLPGITDSNVLAFAAEYCRERRAFMIVDAPVSGGANAVSLMEAAATDASLPSSDHAAVYFPWIYIADREQNGAPRLCPPCGTMAGIYARTDAQRGIWKTPAGIDAPIIGIDKLAYELTDGENGVLNPLGVNCLRRFPAIGPVPWGGRTLRGADVLASEYKYAAIRRLALNIEQSLFRGTQWVVFEPNDEPLWAQIRLNVGAFMDSLFRQGAFQGASANDAYFVRCDANTNPQYDIDRGIVNIVVGFAPLKPVEFVVITIQQKAGQATND
ncbi:MAG: phage tail sheath subtilisin-like domain-containing protein [Deltaproteobacteria bacterium]|nr:phage tail sheath subtilisin-like domain-containing protein [Deltaproteobacteria bacterium]